MTLAASGADRAAEATSLSFGISNEMVDAFAAIIGDRSSLHVDEGFARRSAYRRRVVHGMLPLAFLPVVLPVHPQRWRSVVTAIAGRFVTPVFAGDPLVLSVSAARPAGGDGSVVLDYRVEHGVSSSLATSGTVTVSYERQDDGVDGVLGDAPMLTHLPELRRFSLEEITPGTVDQFEFRITGATIQALADVLALAAPDASIDVQAMNTRVWMPNLLSVLAFSTSVGMCLPGASATFLEFSAVLSGRVELDTAYRLQGKVTHRSAAARIVKKDMVVRHATAGHELPSVLEGRTAALVNKPPVSMPTAKQLKGEAVTDWGVAGKTVLVTGASRGIGETIAKVLGVCGAKVVVNYHRGADDAARVVEEIRGVGGDALAVRADVCDGEAVRSLVRQAIEHFGPVDILVNNAARDYRPVPFLKLAWDDVQHDLDVIAKGAFLCCQQVIPGMIARGGGKIISISTVATDNPPPDQAKYVIAKSALVGLTRSLSIEFASRNIQVNLVVPSFVETDFVSHVQEGFRNKIAQETPMRRHASALDVARAVLFLASPHSSFTTGQKIMVTGGGAPYA